MIRRLLGRRVPDPYEVLIEDLIRVRGYMRAVITTARRLGVPVPPMVVVSVAAWGEWLDHLTRPVEDDES